MANYQETKETEQQAKSARRKWSIATIGLSALSLIMLALKCGKKKSE